MTPPKPDKLIDARAECFGAALDPTHDLIVNGNSNIHAPILRVP